MFTNPANKFRLVWKNPRLPGARLLKRLAILLSGIFVFSSAILLATLWWYRNQEVFLPTPQGSYFVGRIIYDWTDTTRSDPLLDDPHQFRRLNIWIWYPATHVSSPPAPYLSSSWIAVREQGTGLGLLLTQNLARVHGYSLSAPALAPDKPTYPIIIMQPGLGPILADYTTLAESLASYGYVVVGSTPTGSASVVAFEDGCVVPGTPQGNVPETATFTETQRILGALIQVWTDDDRFVLDQVTRLNTDDPGGRFTGRLQLDAVGVMGHSFGGATAAEFCRQDSRCKAGADLDGYLYGDVVQQGLTMPFMFLWSEQSDVHDLIWQQAMRDTDALFQHLPPQSIRATIIGARHFNFADYAVEFAPVIWLQDGLGSIDGQRGLQVTTTYVRAFFDDILRHQHDPLLDLIPSPYPEVRIERR